MKKKSNQKGQALIELIIFLPLMFTLYSLISGFAASINGSINQQKISRSYFYFRVQNNSTIPRPDPERSFTNWSRFGMFFIGWKEFFENGDQPVMPCYRVTLPLAANRGEPCNEKYTDKTSQYVRVGTVYGFCGGTYQTQGNKVFLLPDLLGTDFQQVVDPGSCLIQ